MADLDDPLGCHEPGSQVLLDMKNCIKQIDGDKELDLPIVEPPILETELPTMDGEYRHRMTQFLEKSVEIKCCRTNRVNTTIYLYDHYREPKKVFTKMSLHVPDINPFLTLEIIIQRWGQTLRVFQMMYFSKRFYQISNTVKDGYTVIPFTFLNWKPFHLWYTRVPEVRFRSNSLEQTEVRLEYEYLSNLFHKVMRPSDSKTLWDFDDLEQEEYWHGDISSTIMGKNYYNEQCFTYSKHSRYSYPLEIIIWFLDPYLSAPTILEAELRIETILMDVYQDFAKKSLTNLKKIQYKQFSGYSILLNSVSRERINKVFKKLADNEYLEDDTIKGVNCFTNPTGDDEDYRYEFQVTFVLDEEYPTEQMAANFIFLNKGY